MERMPMCRICLVENVRMYIVVDKDLHELYETLTNIPFVTEDRRPALACFLCFAKLKQCYQLQRKCLEAEELFAQMMNEPNYIVNRSQLKDSSGLIKTPVKNISIAGDSHNESIVIKEELPDVCERRDDIIKTEEHQSDDVELVTVYKIYSDLEDTPALHCSETDSKYDMLLMELQLKTELEEEQLLRKKQRDSDTTREPVVKRPRLQTRNSELKDVITDELKATEQSDTKLVRTSEKRTANPGPEFEQPLTYSKNCRSKTNKENVKCTILNKGIDRSIMIYDINKNQRLRATNRG